MGEIATLQRDGDRILAKLYEILRELQAGIHGLERQPLDEMSSRIAVAV